MTVAVSVSIFFWNPMGNSLEACRSAIGMFYNCSRISSKCVLVQADSYWNILLTNVRCSFLFVSLLVLQSLNPNANVVFLLFVLHFILMIGNVELNPGPESYMSSSPLNLDNSSNDNSISLCNINIRSIRNKTNFVQQFAGRYVLHKRKDWPFAWIWTQRLSSKLFSSWIILEMFTFSVV
jgi:hypothetical protein